jgi:hypothetical protein
MKRLCHGVRMDADVDEVFGAEDGVGWLVDTTAINICPTFILAVTRPSANPCAATSPTTPPT